MCIRDRDYALLIGSRPRGPGMERAELLAVNAEIFTAQGKALNAVASRNVKVLVVGNPANTNAYIAMKSAPDLPRKNFTACLLYTSTGTVSGSTGTLNRFFTVVAGMAAKAVSYTHLDVYKRQVMARRSSDRLD